MDYQKHYDLLCERAKTRQLDCYTERHHVVPRCMGGDDSPDNLVDLTPEEHYVAHQLLVKMYPGHRGLAHSAYMMTVGSEKVPRKNKLYGWLRKKHSKAAKQRTGEKNGSYGRSWYHHPDTLENIKCLPKDVPEGFIQGRRIRSNRKNDKKKSWYHNVETFLNEKFHTDEVPDGWKLGLISRSEVREIERQRKKDDEDCRKREWVDTEIRPLYERYRNGESLQSVARDYEYSFQSLHRYFNMYFPKVHRETGRGNRKIPQ